MTWERNYYQNRINDLKFSKPNKVDQVTSQPELNHKSCLWNSTNLNSDSVSCLSRAFGNTVKNSWSASKGTKIRCILPRDEEFKAGKPHLVKRLEKAEAKLNLTEPIWRSIEFKQKNIIKNLFQILIQKINNQRTS